jgi:2-polyprenyl-3-methyl-5-hydroxy-6-metoxy-1,4-benzoquinol methylase
MNKSEYWENIVDQYQLETKISCDDFHYGPLIHGDSVLKLLPDNLKDLNCLEIACGGAQNSIYLASHGAKCTAWDASKAQMSYAEKLAQENSVDIDLKLMAMEEISPQLGSFDFIHSAYGFNFAFDFDNLISNVFELLNDNGILLFSMPHPLFCGEFLELEDEDGLFIKEYLDIEPEHRYDEDGNETTCSYFYFLDYISYILAENGFLIERLCEPEVCGNPPYTSELWEEYREQMSRFPGTIIIKAIKK